MKQSLIFGSIISMVEKRPFANAALVRDGVFICIGDAEEAKKLAAADARVLDYGEMSSVQVSWAATHTAVLPATAPSDRLPSRRPA